MVPSIKFSRCQEKPGAHSCDRLKDLILHNPLAQYLFHAVRRQTLLSRSFQFRVPVTYSMEKTRQAAAVHFAFDREFYLLCMPPGNFCEFYTIWLDSNANALRATVKNRSRTDAQDLQFSAFQSQPMHKLPIHMRQLCGLFVFMRFAGAARAFLCYPNLCVRSLADFLSPPYPLHNSSSAILVVSAPLGRSHSSHTTHRLKNT